LKCSWNTQIDFNSVLMTLPTLSPCSPKALEAIAGRPG
jgi:hypothetical protein